MARFERIDRYVLLAGAAFCIFLQDASGEEQLPQEIASPVRTPEIQSARSAQIYHELFAQDLFDEAAEVAKHLINDVIAAGGDDLRYADALEKLARAQQMSGKLTAAISNYRSAVQRIELAEDMLAARLVEPLTGLASALAQDNQYGEAAETYERVAHITRVKDGPMNLNQCDILAELAELHAKHSSFDKAVDLLEYQLTIYRRALDETDPRVLTAWRRNGEMLGMAGRHHDAQEHYEYGMDNIRIADGPNSLAQLPLLYDLSTSYLHHAAADRFTRIEMARSQLERAVFIAERNPDATPQQIFDAHLRMGDFMQRYGQWNSARNHYRQAWKQGASDVVLRSATFDTPVMLTPRSVLDDDAAASQFGATTVTVLFDVDRHGRVDNARLQDDSDIDKTARTALMRTRKLIYRPRFDGGQPVMTPDLVHEITVATATGAE